jgi:hypothetical protein
MPVYPFLMVISSIKGNYPKRINIYVQKRKHLLMGKVLLLTGMMFGGPPNLRDKLLTPMHLDL